jgi:hypothetical protein
VSCSGEHVPLDEQHPQRKFHRVFKCSGKNIVLKFFDDDLFLPKINVLQELYSELQYELTDVTADGKLKCLVCKFLQSSEEIIRNVHIIKLLKTLDKLHTIKDMSTVMYGQQTLFLVIQLHILLILT